MKKNLSRKFHEESGVTRLVAILVIIAAALVAIIIIGFATGIFDDTKQSVDDGQEQTCYDSAIMRFTADGKDETFIYDAINKKFLEITKDIIDMKTYGQTKEHEGKVIVVHISADGNITMTWEDPIEYWYTYNK